jgi:hypothetical protein
MQQLMDMIAASPRDQLLVTIKLYDALMNGIGLAREANLLRTVLSIEELRDLCENMFREVYNNETVLYISTGERSAMFKTLFDFFVGVRSTLSIEL